MINVDAVPSKYHFLNSSTHIETFEGAHSPIEPTDLALILDTNDRRLLEPLYSELEKKCREIIFIDHHPVLETGPAPTSGSYIDAEAASTGEIAFRIIEAMDIPLNSDIAKALYTSIAFDTQIFRFVRSSPASHNIAAKLLEFEKNPAEIHRYLFATLSIDKIRFLSKMLEQIEFFESGKIAVLRLTLDDLDKHNMAMEDSRDIIDFIMNINTLMVGVMIREEAKNTFKLSIRSKGEVVVRNLAESFGGGGHLFASGATVHDSIESVREKVIDRLTLLVRNYHDGR